MERLAWQDWHLLFAGFHGTSLISSGTEIIIVRVIMRREASDGSHVIKVDSRDRA